MTRKLNSRLLATLFLFGIMVLLWVSQFPRVTKFVHLTVRIPSGYRGLIHLRRPATHSADRREPNPVVEVLATGIGESNTIFTSVWHETEIFEGPNKLRSWHETELPKDQQVYAFDIPFPIPDPCTGNAEHFFVGTTVAYRRFMEQKRAN